MSIDVTLLCAVLLFGVLGAVSGASRQLGNLAALAAAVVAARPLGAQVVPYLRQAGPLPRWLEGVLGMLLAGLATYVLVRLLVTALVHRLLAREGEARGGADRTLGFLLGGLKVAAVAYALLSTATVVESAFRESGRQLDLGLSGSRAAELARSHNLFDLLRPPAAAAPPQRAPGPAPRRVASDGAPGAR
jgi:membrane protein required for colicin V production